MSQWEMKTMKDETPRFFLRLPKREAWKGQFFCPCTFSFEEQKFEPSSLQNCFVQQQTPPCVL